MRPGQFRITFTGHDSHVLCTTAEDYVGKEDGFTFSLSLMDRNYFENRYDHYDLFDIKVENADEVYFMEGYITNIWFINDNKMGINVRLVCDLDVN